MLKIILSKCSITYGRRNKNYGNIKDLIKKLFKNKSMRKIIYLQDGKNIFQKYEYENISDLNEEFKKRKITIGDSVRIEDSASIGNMAIIGDNASIGYNASIGNNARIVEWAGIGAWASIGNMAIIGDNASIGNSARIEEWASIGDRARIGEFAKIGAWARIEKYNSFFAVNIYDHPCGAWIEEKRGEIIQLGCFTRTRKEWEDDFWNNKKEFPNDNSDKSNARIRAFKMCCLFLDLIKK